MIRSFADKDTEKVWNRAYVRKFDPNVQRAALRRLLALDAAEALSDMATPPGNRLEPLKGDREGQHSVRVNNQWRVCFTWSAGGADDVEIVDYH